MYIYFLVLEEERSLQLKCFNKSNNNQIIIIMMLLMAKVDQPNLMKWIASNFLNKNVLKIQVNYCIGPPKRHFRYAST